LLLTSHYQLYRYSESSPVIGGFSHDRPAYLTIYVLAGSAAVILTLLFGLRAAIAQAEWPARDRIVVVWTAALILISWFALAALLGADGAFHANAGRLPSIQYGLFLPILVGALLIWRSATVRRVIEAVPQA
jgi:hypothetical protein